MAWSRITKRLVCSHLVILVSLRKVRDKFKVKLQPPIVSHISLIDVKTTCLMLLSLFIQNIIYAAHISFPFFYFPSKKAKDCLFQ